MGVFGDVRSILQQPPSEHTFRALCVLFEAGECDEAVFHYVRSQLRFWPDAILRVIPEHWLPLDGGDLPRLAGLYNTLSLPFNKPDFDTLCDWLESPNLERLSTLRLPGYPLTKRQWQTLADLDALQQLDRLDLTGSQLGYSGIKTLCELPFVQQLREVVFDDNHLDQRSIQKLASTPWRRLEGLSLRDNPLDTVSVSFLMGSDALVGLQSLDLAGAVLGYKGVALLNAATLTSALRVLGLDSCHLGESGFEELVFGCDMPRLERLSLARNAITVSARSGSEFQRFEALTHVNFCNAGIYCSSLRNLRDGGALDRVVELDLSGNDMRDHGVKVLASSMRMKRLRVLALGANGLGADGVVALANAPWVGQLESLALGGNRFGLDAVTALAESPYLRSEIRTYWANKRDWMLENAEWLSL